MKITRRHLRQLIAESLDTREKSNYRPYTGDQLVAAAKKHAFKSSQNYPVEMLKEYDVDPWDETQPFEIFFHPYLVKMRKITGQKEREKCSKRPRIDTDAAIQFGRERDELSSQLGRLKAQQWVLSDKISELKAIGIGEGIDERVRELIEQENMIAKQISAVMEKIKINARAMSDHARTSTRDYMGAVYERETEHYVCRFDAFSLSDIIKKFETDYAIANKSSIISQFK
jgi:hypothetical protein